MESPRLAAESSAVSWRRRFIRPTFSLRMLLLGMAIVAAGLGMFQRLDQTRQLVARIEAPGGSVRYSARESNGRCETWLRERLPRTYFDDVEYVGCYESTENVDGILAQLVGLKSLKWLELRNTQVSDSGLAHLGGLKTLVWLEFKNTRISDAGLRHLGGLTSLEVLDLNHTQFSDAGLRHLAGLKALIILDLRYTQVSDTGLAHLVGLKSLNILRLSDTQVSDAGFEQLKTSLPDCRVSGRLESSDQ